MNYFKPNKTIFDEFFEHRDMLIIQHMNGDISKKEYLDLNYRYMLEKNIKPFQRIDSFEKGMYNYQYYNMLAKYHRMIAQEIKDKGKHISFYSKYLEEADYYYNEKDKTSFRLLRYLHYENVESYFIKMESSALEGKLYEIVLKDYEYAVLHSKSLWLLDVLKKENVFLAERKKSVIDYYVNQKY
ncbi:DUF6648 family protein [Sedimentibacter sp. B4]|uniref:DUF6648 family protein n=1 Tax=Sedimentibacter sp. B4 TaxID=304766 RepID=UPI0002F3DE71|nr:DUF6648 family protein [Sedimentibacter sp. B4]